IAQSIHDLDGVEEVQFGGEWVRRMDRFLETLQVTGFGIAALIALVVLFGVSNAIRLTIVARREIHRVMALLGASRRFIRSPLILEGAMVSVLAAALALGVLYLLFLAVEERLVVLPVFLPWRWALAFVAAAGILGAAGSTLGVTRIGREERH